MKSAQLRQHFVYLSGLSIRGDCESLQATLSDTK